jgi:hypothetical protein
VPAEAGSGVGRVSLKIKLTFNPSHAEAQSSRRESINFL